MTKKVLVILLCFLILLTFGCNSDTKMKETYIDDFVWTNSNSFYIYVKEEYTFDELKNIENSFNSYDFEKIYVVNINKSDGILVLLVVFDELKYDYSDLYSKIMTDDIVSSVSYCYDVPFESSDDRYIDCTKNCINVGEEIIMELKGRKKVYIPQFSFNSFFCKAKNNKKVRMEELKKVGIISIESKDNGWLLFNLETNDYFKLVKVMDAVSGMDFVNEINVDKSEITIPPPSIWQTSNNDVIEIIDISDDYSKIKVIGKSIGEAFIEIDGINFTLNVE